MISAFAIAPFAAGGQSESDPASADSTSGDCKLEETVTNFLDKREAFVPDSKKSPETVLAFNHRKGSWSAYEVSWEQGVTSSLARVDDLTDVSIPNSWLKIGLENVPSVQATKNTRIVYLVVDTNPLLYTVDQTQVVVSDTDDVEELEGFLQALGASLSMWIKTSKSRELPEPPREQDVSMAYKSIDRAPDQARIKGIREAIKKFIAGLQGRIDRESKAIDDLETAIDSIEELSREVERDANKIVLAAQEVELDRAPSDESWKEIGSDYLGEISLRRGELASRTEDLQNAVTECHESYAILGEVIGSVLSATPKTKVSSERLAKATKTVELMTEAIQIRRGCSTTESQLFASLGEALEVIPITEAAPDQVLMNTWSPVKNSVEIYLRLNSHMDDVLATTAAAYQKSAVLVPAAARLYQFERTAKSSDSGTDNGCDFRVGVLEIERPPAPWQWNKQIVETAKIMDRGLSAVSTVERTREIDVEFSYKVLLKRTFEFSISFGFIYSEIVDPTWTAVTNPIDSDTKVIARTEESSRSGSPTLLLTLHPWGLNQRKLRPGFDLGVSWNSSSPGLLAGFSVGLTRFLRLGAGWTWQQVSELSPGQTELSYLPDGSIDPESLTPVSDTSDIRTRSTFDDDYYISLVFNFSGLDIFKPKD